MQIIELKDSPPISNEIGNDLQKIQKNGYNILQTYFISIPKKEIQNQQKLETEIDQQLNENFNTNDNFLIFPTNQTKDYLESAFQTCIVKNIAELKQKIFSLLYNTKTIKETNEKNNTETIIISQLTQKNNRGNIFTKNPLNGLNETILEITLENPNQEAQIEHLINQKTKPPNEKTNEINTKNPWIKTVLEEATKLEKLFGEPLFLEWIYNEDKLYWVQIRRLKGIKPPTIYSNKIAKDMLPGLIKPLVWSINTKINGTAWKQLMNKVIGENNFELNKMTKRFYGRAYFNMGLFGDFFTLFGMPRETLELMMLGEAHSRKTSMPKIKMNMKVSRFLPRISLLILKNISISKKIEKFIQNQKNRIDQTAKDLDNLDEKATLEKIEKLLKLNEECSLYVIVVRMIRSFHFSLLRMMLKQKRLNSTIEINNEDLKDVDAKYSLIELKKMLELMPDHIRESLENNQTQILEKDNPEFIQAYNHFLTKFGHMSDSTVDMSQIQWKENPQIIIQMIKTASTETKKPDKNQNLPKGLYGLVFKRFLNFFISLEKQSARLGYLYAYGYSKLRPHFMHIGDLFKSKNIINENQDIFYLDYNEIKTIIEKRDTQQDFLKKIDERKNEINTYKEILVPEIIFGNQAAPAIRNGAISSRFKGLAASQGYYQGKTKVVKTLSEASKVIKGDVLIIPFSDTSWTPLLSKAGAIISETGGKLSHCSIIARELGIPAIVGVEAATNIPDNVEVRIDGYTGEILIIR